MSHRWMVRSSAVPQTGTLLFGTTWSKKACRDHLNNAGWSTNIVGVLPCGPPHATIAHAGPAPGSQLTPDSLKASVHLTAAALCDRTAMWNVFIDRAADLDPVPIAVHNPVLA